MTRQTFSKVSNSFAVSKNLSPRITRDDLQTLRSVQFRKQNPLVAFIHAVAKSIQESMFDLCSKKDNRNNTMCKNYGHVIRGKWAGYLPKCADCGQTISSSDQLRKSTLNTEELRKPSTEGKKMVLSKR